jgi:hypothetical protein
MRIGNSSASVFWLCLAMGVGAAVPVAAVTHNVPGEYTTITAALAAASAGDTVLVAPGIYSPSSNGETFPLTVTVDSLHLLGAGMNQAIVDAESTASVFVFLGSVGARLSGFTITGGWADRGAGIWVKPDTPMEIDHNLVYANGAGLLAAGIFLDSDGWVHHNVVWENFDTDTADTQDPHGVRIQREATPVFEHNLVGRTDGNGLIVSSTAAPTVRHNIFYENGQPAPMRRGRGICWFSTMPLIVYHNLFYNNEVAAMLVPDLGGDFSGEEANVLFPDDDIYGNIDADPHLVDPDNRDFQLNQGSPAIDAGDPGLPYDPDSTIADIGPFYFDQSGGGVPWSEAADGGALSILSGPLSPVTTIEFVLHDPGPATLAVYDVRGRRLAVLADEHLLAGVFEVIWDRRNDSGSEVGSGVYFLRLSTGNKVIAGSFILLR